MRYGRLLAAPFLLFFGLAFIGACQDAGSSGNAADSGSGNSNPDAGGPSGGAGGRSGSAGGSSGSGGMGSAGTGSDAATADDAGAEVDASGTAGASLPTVRTLHYHQITSHVDDELHGSGGGNRPDPLISHDGQHVLYGLTVGDTLGLWMADSDGSGTERLATEDDFYDFDMSSNGSVVVYSTPETIHTIGTGGGMIQDYGTNGWAASVRVAGNGSRVFWVLNRSGDGNSNITFDELGVYTSAVDGSGPQQIVTPADVRTLVGDEFEVADDDVRFSSDSCYNCVLDVSQDGQRIVFIAGETVSPRKMWVFAKQLGGSLSVLSEAVPDRGLYSVALSSDGSRVAYEGNIDGTVQGRSVGFDGTNPTTYVDERDTYGRRLSISDNGARVMHGDRWLYATNGGETLDLHSKGAARTSCMVMTTLAGNGRLVSQKCVLPGSSQEQVVTAEIDADSDGAAPGVASVSVEPSTMIAGDSMRSTITVELTSATEALDAQGQALFYLDDIVEDSFKFTGFNGASIPLGTEDDTVYTGRSSAAMDTEPGDRTLRVGFERADGDGRHHGIAVEVSGITVTAP